VDEDDVYGLDDEDIIRLRRLLDAFEAGRLDADPPDDRGPFLPTLETRLGRTLTSIAARSGATPGSGDVDYTSVDGVSGDLVTADTTDTAYSLSASIIPAGTYVALAREPYSGQLFVSNVDSAPGFEVSDVTNTPDFTDLHEIITDATEGLHWTQTGPEALTSQVELHLHPASVTQTGAITAIAQTLAGIKTLRDGLYVGNAGTFPYASLLPPQSSFHGELVIGLDSTHSASFGLLMGSFTGLPAGNPGPQLLLNISTGTGGISSQLGLLEAYPNAHDTTLLLAGTGLIGLGAVTRYAVFQAGNGIQLGDTGTDPVGNIFTGGLCTHVGATGAAVTIGAAVVGGTATNFLYVGAGPVLAQAAAGDLTVSAGAVKVTGLQGTPVSATAPTTAGQGFAFNGASWTPTPAASGSGAPAGTGVTGETYFDVSDPNNPKLYYWS
jgi:hypothetical protein